MKDEIKEIYNELKNENKAPTMNNIREKLELERIENNNKDEIKEIREALKVDEEELELKSSVYPLELTPKEQKILLDYITNLQEENERLKRDKNMIFDANCNLSKVMNNYKTRIDKVIEEIKKRSTKEVADLYINLLQGKSDE